MLHNQCRSKFFTYINSFYHNNNSIRLPHFTYGDIKVENKQNVQESCPRTNS